MDLPTLLSMPVALTEAAYTNVHPLETDRERVEEIDCGQCVPQLTGPSDWLVCALADQPVWSWTVVTECLADQSV